MQSKRFRVHVAQDDLDDLNARLDNVRWPDQPVDDSWGRGADIGFLRSLISYWRRGFDWRAQEEKLNSLDQFVCQIDGFEIHFVHERGKGPNPFPVILTHGWPDSFLRYQKIVPLLTDPAAHGGSPEDSFDVIVPSIPGIGFSRAPDGARCNNCDISELWHTLMTRVLGYAAFGASGGDLGSGVTRYLASNHPRDLAGIHLSDVGIIRDLVAAPDPAALSRDCAEYRVAAQKWLSEESGYMAIQSTKPETLAYALSDSPVGLAAWIAEKFRAWSGCGGDLRRSFTDDELLADIMIYWATNSSASSSRIYYDNVHSLPPMLPIEIPVGIALFPADVLPPPREWVEKNYNVIRWSRLARGGHFTAMEEPALYAEDLRAFFRPLRSR